MVMMVVVVVVVTATMMVAEMANSDGSLFVVSHSIRKGWQVNTFAGYLDGDGDDNDGSGGNVIMSSRAWGECACLSH